MSEKIRRLVAELRRELGQLYSDRLRGVYLFGSYARDSAGAESDVDVLVVLDRVEHYGAEVDRSGGVVSTLSLKYGVSISRVFVSEHEWAAGKGSFLRNLKAEALPV